MKDIPAEFERRAEAALAAIQGAYGTPEDEYGGTLFVSHHLEHVGEDYWLKHVGSASPEPKEVLGLLEIHSDLEDGLEVLDFSLPGEVSNYLICVTFGEDGDVEGISMES